MRNTILLVINSFLVLLLVGCGSQDKIVEAETETDTDSNAIIEDYIIEEYDGEPLKTYDVVYTLDEVLSLTFDRILPKEQLIPLLEELDKHQIKATFFGSYEQLVMNPAAVEEILNRGHTIESNPFYKVNVKLLNYEDIFQLMKINNDYIEEITGTSPEYVHLHSSKKRKDINKVAAQLEMSGVVHHSYQLRGLKTDDAEKLMEYMNRAVARGGILSMDPEDAHAIPYLMDAINAVNFKIIPLNNLIELDQNRKSFKEIAGSDAIRKNLDFTNVQPFIHIKEVTDKKEVALTFDDWASEATVLKVLDILAEYDIQSTFYLKTNIIEENPNLARLLIERGHEVANHSHSHLDSTSLTVEELQDDLFTAHKIITEAIQEQPKLYFRPPFGKVNDEAAMAISAMGFEAIASYDVSSYDWNDEYTEEDVINRVMSRVQPGSVIVMHILNNIHTPSVLPGLIEALHGEGYEFVLTSKWIEKMD